MFKEPEFMAISSFLAKKVVKSSLDAQNCSTPIITGHEKNNLVTFLPRFFMSYIIVSLVGWFYDGLRWLSMGFDR